MSNEWWSVVVTVFILSLCFYIDWMSWSCPIWPNSTTIMKRPSHRKWDLARCRNMRTSYGTRSIPPLGRFSTYKSTNQERPGTTMQRIKNQPSIYQSTGRSNPVTFPMTGQVKVLMLMVVIFDPQKGSLSPLRGCKSNSTVPQGISSPSRSVPMQMPPCTNILKTQNN